jgi:hypothetical protein
MQREYASYGQSARRGQIVPGRADTYQYLALHVYQLKKAGRQGDVGVSVRELSQFTL